MIKNLPGHQEMLEMWAQSLGREDPLEEEMAIHSSILAWEIPQTEERMVGYGPEGHKESHTTEQLSTSTLHRKLKTLKPYPPR